MFHFYNKNYLMKLNSISTKVFIIIFYSIFIYSCKQEEVKSIRLQSEQIDKNDKATIAFELCAMYGLDQGIRDREIFSLLGHTSRNIDTLSFNRLVTFVKKHGYPNEELVGKENYKYECVAMAATAIMLHNPYRLVNEKEYFNLFLNEIEKGNMSRDFLATVLDKHYWSRSRGERVMYGSQFGIPCIETKEETNRLRKEIGLKPLKNDEFKECD